MIYKNTIHFLIGILLLTTTSACAQSMSRADIHNAARASMDASLTEYRSFLSIPNLSRIEKHRNDNAIWCVETFKQLGFQTQILTSEGIPHVFAEKVFNPRYKSILFYLQIDGQPVDNTKWNQEDPFIPVLKRQVDNQWEIVNWDILKQGFDPDLRVYARSSSDSKGPAMAFITALRILTKKGIDPKFNIKVIMDLQEEIGSPTLSPLVQKKRALFDSEMLLIMDGTRHLSNLPTLTFGCRGLATVQLKVFGARKALHSGQYGNFSPSPVFHSSKLIAGMKSEDGRVLIPGFYEGVNLTDAEKAEMNSLPENINEIKQTLGIADYDRVGNTYQEALQYPSLNVRGLSAAWVGKNVRTIIPSEALAEIDIRLVKETPGERQVALLKKYIEEQGYRFVDSIPTEDERMMYPKLISMTHKLGSKPFRTELDSNIGRWLSKAMEHMYDDKYVKMRLTGGSQPIAPFINTLGIPAVSIRIPNPDNSIHAPNENLRLGNYLEGIEMCLSILVQDMKDWK